MTATVVDVGALWRTIWTATAGGVLVTVCCSVAVLGAARAQEHRDGTAGVAGRWAALATVGLVATATVIVYGVVLVVQH